MESVNEGSTCYVTATFRNKSGANEAPASATWEAIDLKSGTIMQAEASLTPGGSIEITIPPAVNAIVDETKIEEIRRITVKATYNASDKVTGQYDYRVINLSKVP